MTIALIGVPSDSAGIAGGVAGAPAALRAAGLVDALRRVGEVVDRGDVPLPEPVPGREPITGLIDPAMFAAVSRATEDAVRQARADGHFPMVLGGDCSLLPACIAGSGADGLLFVDGHEDAYTAQTSPTGEVSDMELGLLLGRSPLPDGMPSVRLEPSAVAVLGARDGHALHEEGIESLRGVLSYADDTEVRVDPERMAERAIAGIPAPFWFHVDLDVLSSDALPAIDYPQPGGIGWFDLMGVARVALAARPLGWDVTIYNPDLDPERTAARRIIRFLAEAAELL